MSRRLRSVLPITLNQLTPEVIDPSHVSEQLDKKQLLRKQYYDQGSRPLNELKPRDPVYMQAGNHWIPATVIQKANTPHSYIVRTTEGHTYRRNRRHLKISPTQEQRSDHSMTVYIELHHLNLSLRVVNLSKPLPDFRTMLMQLPFLFLGGVVV